MTAEEFKDFKDNSTEDEVNAHFDKLMFTSFNIMVNGKYENYQGQTRVRFFAVKVFPLNTQAENRALIRRLELYKEMPQL
jgi:hypothetical protein